MPSPRPRRLATPLAARASAQATAIQFYSNPTTGLVQVQASRSLDGTVVQLYGAQGRAVLAATVCQGRLGVGGLPAGVCYLRFKGGGETVRQRLMRQAN